MILHCSKKLAAKLTDISPVPLHETSPLGSWHGHLLTFDRRQCVMLCHDATRYVLFLPGLRKEHFAEFEARCFRPLYLATLAALGCPVAWIKKTELALGSMRFDTATDRSVLGSLNISASDTEVWLQREANVMDIDPLAVSCKLNGRPMTLRGKTIWPAKAMRELVSRL